MKEMKVTINDKGVLLIIMTILILTFMLGFMVSDGRKEKNVTVFTREELTRISTLQAMEDAKEFGANVYAYKDKEGNLMIGWTYEEEEK